jgi:hypothetical protein
MSITERLRRRHPDLGARMVYVDEVRPEASLPRDLVVNLHAVAAEIAELREVEAQLDAPLDSILARLDGLVASSYRHAANLTVAQLASPPLGRRGRGDPDAP